MKNTLKILALSITAFAAQAEQTATITGDNGKSEMQNIGDSLVQDVRTNSTSTQLGNSANANGASISVPTNVDTRDQNTVAVNPTTTSAGGSSHGNLSSNDNRSAVGNTSSNSGGNNLADTNDNRSTATSGPVTGTNTSRFDAANTSRNDTSSSANGTNLSSNRTASSAAGGAGGSASAGGGAGGQGGSGGSGGSGGNSQAAGGSSQQGQSQGLRESGNSSTRSATRVDASDRSVTNYTSRATVLPPTVHGAAAPPLAVGQMAVVSSACGPRVGIVRRDIVGKRFGVWGGQDDVLQGQDEITAPAAQPFVVVDGYLLGHIVTTYTTTVGTSSAGSFSVGGYGKSGEGAQGGGAASGQLQQIVQRVVVTECLMPQVAAVVVPQPDHKPVPAPLPRQDRN